MLGLTNPQDSGRLSMWTFAFCIGGLDREGRAAFLGGLETCLGKGGSRRSHGCRMEFRNLLEIHLSKLLFLFGFLESNFHRRRNRLCPLGNRFFRKCLLLFSFVFFLLFEKLGLNHFRKVL